MLFSDDDCSSNYNGQNNWKEREKTEIVRKYEMQIVLIQRTQTIKIC